MSHTNTLGQPVGFPLPDWTPSKRPSRTSMDGYWCRVEPLDLNRHASDLFHAYSKDAQGTLWTYLPWGPFDTVDGLCAFAQANLLGDDPLCFAIVDVRTKRAVGIACYLRINPEAGTIEVGGLAFSPELQRTTAATEAMYLMMRRAFDELGYRRYEWTCDSLNAPSRAASLRLGFCYEGVLRQVAIRKGRNRDTAWFSILDHEWPSCKQALEKWLQPSNFTSDGEQIKRLAIPKQLH